MLHKSFPPASHFQRKCYLHNFPCGCTMDLCCSEILHLSISVRGSRKGWVGWYQLAKLVFCCPHLVRFHITPLGRLHGWIFTWGQQGELGTQGGDTGIVPSHLLTTPPSVSKQSLEWAQWLLLNADFQHNVLPFQMVIFTSRAMGPRNFPSEKDMLLLGIHFHL